MAQPTIGNVQQIDPVLTNLAIGYQQAQDRFVAAKVFPYVPVDKARDTYYVFDKKYWFTDSMQPRTPGGDFARSGYSLSTGTVVTLQYALAHQIPDEVVANSQVPFSLEEAGTRWLAQQSLIRKERAFSTDFMAISVWGTDDNNSATDWNNYTAGDPVTNVLTARRTISNNTGIDGNSMVLGYFVHQGLMNHPDIIDRVKFVQMATAANVESAMAALFGLTNYWVGKASYNSANEGQTFSGSGIIGNDALVCAVTGNPGIFEASAGYSFMWQPGGGQGTIARYRDDHIRSDVLQSFEQWDQKAVATDLGYFFHTIVA